MGEYVVNRWLNAGLLLSIFFSFFTVYTGVVSIAEEISRF
jgi:hypothetical protein